MIYNNLIYNNQIIDQFQKYKNNKIPHAFIFYGNQGTGKFSHAIEFANIILSNQTDDNKNTAQRIKDNLHENINYITPLPKIKNISKHDSAFKAINNNIIDDIQNQIILKLKNPYHNIMIDKANNILINSIRDLKKRISLSNYNDKPNIHIIIDADRLCYPRQESANALLKILEEPNENNIFILITSNFSRMLDTIKSRSTKIFFKSLNNEEIHNYLMDNYNVEHDKALFLSNISNRDISKAKEILDDYDNIIDIFNNIIDLLFNKNLVLWQKYISSIKDKKIIKLILDITEIFLMDVIRNRIDRYKLVESTIQLNNTYDEKIISELVKIINETKKNLDKHIYIPLLLTTFYIEFKSIINERNFKNNLINYTSI